MEININDIIFMTFTLRSVFFFSLEQLWNCCLFNIKIISENIKKAIMKDINYNYERSKEATMKNTHKIE